MTVGTSQQRRRVECGTVWWFKLLWETRQSRRLGGLGAHLAQLKFCSGSEKIGRAKFFSHSAATPATKGIDATKPKSLLEKTEKREDEGPPTVHMSRHTSSCPLFKILNIPYRCPVPKRNRLLSMIPALQPRSFPLPCFSGSV